MKVKYWTKYVSVEKSAQEQIARTASLNIVYPHIAVMPDCHYGKGSTVGTVIPTRRALIPASVGVDIGCGMMAVQTSLYTSQLPDNLKEFRLALEKEIPIGFNRKGTIGKWKDIPKIVEYTWRLELKNEFDKLTEKYAFLKKTNNISHLGTLGSGNHFIEICCDETEKVWIMLHSGSRGVGNSIGRHFIEIAKIECDYHKIQLPDKDLSYLIEGANSFTDYVESLGWAQKFAYFNRQIMMDIVTRIFTENVKDIFCTSVAVNCHHNYVEGILHDRIPVYLTRKGAISAKKGELGIIPGSMGTKSFIVEGKGNQNSFCSCSHGAGRSLSRTAARQKISVEDHIRATEGIECKKDKSVIDESPAAYKNIDKVMASQADLVSIKHTLLPLLNLKG